MLILSIQDLRLDWIHSQHLLSKESFCSTSNKGNCASWCLRQHREMWTKSPCGEVERKDDWLSRTLEGRWGLSRTEHHCSVQTNKEFSLFPAVSSAGSISARSMTEASGMWRSPFVWLFPQVAFTPQNPSPGVEAVSGVRMPPPPPSSQLHFLGRLTWDSVVPPSLWIIDLLPEERGSRGFQWRRGRWN